MNDETLQTDLWSGPGVPPPRQARERQGSEEPQDDGPAGRDASPGQHVPAASDTHLPPSETPVIRVDRARRRGVRGAAQSAASFELADGLERVAVPIPPRVGRPVHRAKERQDEVVGGQKAGRVGSSTGGTRRVCGRWEIF